MDEIIFNVFDEKQFIPVTISIEEFRESIKELKSQNLQDKDVIIIDTFWGK